MEQSPSWEANRISASQVIPRILWNPNVHYRINKRQPPLTILSHTNLLRPPFYFLKKHFSIILPSTLMFFPSGFHTKTLYTSLLSPQCPIHLFLLDLVTWTLLGGHCRIFSSTLWSFLYSPFTSSLLGPQNILLYTLFSNTPSLRFSLNVSYQVSHPYKTTRKRIVLYIVSSRHGYKKNVCTGILFIFMGVGGARQNVVARNSETDE